MDSSATITLSDLPSSVLSKIPFSIRTKKSSYTLSDLPTEIQYLIEKYYEQKVPEITYKSVLDGFFDISAYSDFGVYTSVKDLIGEYIHNYLLIRVGSFPYDIDFGCSIKDNIQAKDTSVREALLETDLQQLCKVISNDYGVAVTISNLSFDKYLDYDKTIYQVSITVKVEDETITINA